MKTQRFTLIAAFIGFLFAIPCFAQTKLQIVTLEYRPHIFTEDNVVKGIYYDVIMEMGKRTGIQVEIMVLPWRRALNMLEQGECDAAFPASKTPEREMYAIFMNEDLYKSEYGLFVRRGEEFQFDKIEDLYGKTIGIAAGNACTPEFEEAKKAHRFTIDEGGGTIEQNFQKLIRDRFDIYIVNIMAGLDAIKRLNISDQVTVLPKRIAKGAGEGLPKYLMFSKAAKIDKKEELMLLFDKTLVEMKTDGTVNAIIEKYLK